MAARTSASATWNASDHGVISRAAGITVFCKPHDGAYGYGHTLEAIATCALAVRRLSAFLCFVPTDTDVDAMTHLESDQIRMSSFRGFTALAWRLQLVGCQARSGALGASATLWRIMNALAAAADDPRRTKRTRHRLKGIVRLLRHRAADRLARGKRAVRAAHIGGAPRLSPADWQELAERPLDLRL